MNKRLFFTIIAIMFASVSDAQILSNEEDIYNMMMSSRYYYGDNTSSLDSVAKTNALNDLLTRNRGTYINPEDVVYYYYVFGIGGESYIRVAAFVEKNRQTESAKIEKHNQHKNNPNDNLTAKKDNKTDNNGNTTETGSLIENMMQYTDLPSMMEYMERLKATQRITDYGPYRNCNNQSAVCWAIFDNKNKMIAILSENTGSRYNYVTKQNDNLDKYINVSYKLMWFSIND